MMEIPNLPKPLEDSLGAKRFIDDHQIRLQAPDEFSRGMEGIDGAKKPHVIASA
jgi:hypothetical protein